MALDTEHKVAVVGCGYWGNNLVRDFNRLGALAGICDTTDAGRALAAETAPGIPVSDNFDSILNSDIAGVVIATPAETHYALARQALEAGKDVFVEKPLALAYDQGVQLVRLAEERNAILMVGHVLEYHPAIVFLRRLVESGELGSIRYISSNRLNPGKVRREENILWSFAPHDIAVTLRLMGSLPYEVAAHGGSYLQPNIADVTMTHLLFDGGVRAHIYVSWLHPFKEQRLVVVGSKKSASFDDVTKRLVLYDQRVETHDGYPVLIKDKGHVVEFSAGEPLLLECQAFLHALVTREPPIASGVSALPVLRILQAAQRSLTTNGQPVTLPMS